MVKIPVAVIFHGFLGLAGFIGLAFLLSENKRCVKPTLIFIGLSLQIILAIVLAKVPFFLDFFTAINKGVLSLTQATLEGTRFVFGYIGGAPLPFKTDGTGSTFSLAFQAMPLVIVISALSAILFYLRVLPFFIKGIALILGKCLHIGGALAVAVSANLFIGMAESPLVIRPYLNQLTRSELFTLMTCGMAGVAGSVMALYAIILSPIIPNVMEHVISAVLISLPAAILISKIIVPETQIETAGQEIYREESLGLVDALIKGVKLGGEIFVSIIAMLLVLVALVAFADKLLSLLPALGGQPITLAYLLGFIFEPFMWLMGIPWSQAHPAGDLMATRLVLNELVSYGQLATLAPGILDSRSQLMLLYSMCGFANFSGLGIMLSAYNVLIPNRRSEFISLGFKALFAGTICTCMTGTIIGVLYY